MANVEHSIQQVEDCLDELRRSALTTAIKYNNCSQEASLLAKAVYDYIVAPQIGLRGLSLSLERFMMHHSSNFTSCG